MFPKPSPWLHRQVFLIRRLRIARDLSQAGVARVVIDRIWL
jgi:hypothetical protein